MEFEIPEITGIRRWLQGFNELLWNRPKQRIIRNLLTESLYLMLHRFFNARAAHKGKSKGKD